MSSRVKADDLGPCPFCGKDLYYCDKDGDKDEPNRNWVTCYQSRCTFGVVNAINYSIQVNHREEKEDKPTSGEMNALACAQDIADKLAAILNTTAIQEEGRFRAPGAEEYRAVIEDILEDLEIYGFVPIQEVRITGAQHPRENDNTGDIAIALPSIEDNDNKEGEGTAMLYSEWQGGDDKECDEDTDDGDDITCSDCAERETCPVSPYLK